MLVTDKYSVCATLLQQWYNNPELFIIYLLTHGEVLHKVTGQNPYCLISLKENIIRKIWTILIPVCFLC